MPRTWPGLHGPTKSPPGLKLFSTRQYLRGLGRIEATRGPAVDRSFIRKLHARTSAQRSSPGAEVCRAVGRTRDVSPSSFKEGRHASTQAPGALALGGATSGARSRMQHPECKALGFLEDLVFSQEIHVDRCLKSFPWTFGESAARKSIPPDIVPALSHTLQVQRLGSGGPLVFELRGRVIDDRMGGDRH